MNMQILNWRITHKVSQLNSYLATVRLVKKLIILILLGTLAGCTLPTRYERDPAKAGFGRDDVKKSRCACMKFYENGKWL